MGLILGTDTGNSYLIPGLTKRLTAFALDYIPILGYVVVLLAIGAGSTLVAGPLE